MASSIDHDAAFKMLLKAFFAEFLELFAPALASQLNPAELEFLETESFVDLIDPDRRTADLIVQTRLRQQRATILIHLEHQAQQDKLLHRRMFRYFSRFYDRYDVPIYPIALCSYQSPKQAPAASHRVSIAPFSVLEFNFQVVQLSHLRWRDYLSSNNPVAIALMARMPIAKSDRWRVKAACLRRAVGLPLTRQARQLIAQFVDLYVPLNASEEVALQTDLQDLSRVEQERYMEIVTSWERNAHAKGRTEGRTEGRMEGARAVVLRLATKKFGALAEARLSTIATLAVEQLEELNVALLDFATLSDLDAWLADPPAVDQRTE